MGDDCGCKAFKLLALFLDIVANLCIFYLFVHSVTNVYGYQPEPNLFRGYECNDPKDLSRFPSEPANCVSKDDILRVDEVSYSVWYHEPSRLLRGWSCRAELHQVSENCDQTKLDTFLAALSVSETECQEMWDFQRYVDMINNTHILSKKSINHIPLATGPGNLKCFPTNSPPRLQDLSSDRIGPDTILTIQLKEETFLSSDYDDRIEHYSTRVKLPCRSFRQWCVQEDTTYLWTNRESTCPQEVWGQVKGVLVVGTEGPELFVSTDGKDLRLIKNNENRVLMCDKKYHVTNDPHIYLSSPTFSGVRNLPDDPWDMRRSTPYLYRDETIGHHSRGPPNGALILKEYRHFLTKRCQATQLHFSQDPWAHRHDPGVVTWSTEPGLFVHSVGGMTCQYQCTRVYVILREAARCYHALPVYRISFQSNATGLKEQTAPVLMQVDPKPVYLEAQTYRIVTEGYRLDCNSMTLPRFKNLLGQVVIAKPYLLQLEDLFQEEEVSNVETKNFTLRFRIQHEKMLARRNQEVELMLHDFKERTQTSILLLQIVLTLLVIGGIASYTLETFWRFSLAHRYHKWTVAIPMALCTTNIMMQRALRTKEWNKPTREAPIIRLSKRGVVQKNSEEARTREAALLEKSIPLPSPKIEETKTIGGE